jgi:hypothetical protein
MTIDVKFNDSGRADDPRSITIPCKEKFNG